MISEGEAEQLSADVNPFCWVYACTKLETHASQPGRPSLATLGSSSDSPAPRAESSSSPLSESDPAATVDTNTRSNLACVDFPP